MREVNSLLLLEKVLECRPGLLHDCALARVALSILVRRKEVAKIRPVAVSHPLCLRLAATIVRRRVVIRAVQATMNIRPALRALFLPRDIAGLKLHLHATMMTNH